MSVFHTVLTSIGSVYDNHTLYLLAKAEYMKRGYNAKQAQYAALGLMSWYSQHNYCKYYTKENTIQFERIA